MLVKFLHSHKIPLQIAGKVLVLVVKILLVYCFTCLFICLFVCFAWPCLSCVGRFPTFAGVACHRWRCSALLVFCLALFSVVWLCWRWLCWRCWSLLYPETLIQLSRNFNTSNSLALFSVACFLLGVMLMHFGCICNDFACL